MAPRYLRPTTKCNPTCYCVFLIRFAAFLPTQPEPSLHTSPTALLSLLRPDANSPILSLRPSNPTTALPRLCPDSWQPPSTLDCTLRQTQSAQLSIPTQLSAPQHACPTQCASFIANSPKIPDLEPLFVINSAPVRLSRQSCLLVRRAWPPLSFGMLR